MTYWYRREQMLKGDSPGHPFRGNQYTHGQFAGREVDAKGYLVPVVGDTVFQVVRGLGGAPARIYGEVYRTGKNLRVRVTGANDAFARVPKKTYALNEYWVVNDDPKLERDKQAREQQAKDKAAADEAARQKLRNDAADKAAKQVAAGAVPLTEEAAKAGGEAYNGWEDKWEKLEAVENPRKGTVEIYVGGRFVGSPENFKYYAVRKP